MPKILLVDDSKTVLMMEKMILQKENFTVVEAENGRVAVDLALAERPDLILMDVVMPEMDGVAACRALQKNPLTKPIPIILVTTKSEQAMVAAGREAGCTDYVLKPIHAPELLGKVRILLKKQGERRT